METAHFDNLGPEEYRFWLPMPRVIAFQRETNSTMWSLYADLAESIVVIGENPVLAGGSKSGHDHVIALIRNALVGGGLEEKTARQLVETYCYPAQSQVSDGWLALKVLRAAINGIETVSKKKARPARSRSRSAKA